MTGVEERRQKLRKALIAAAERAISRRGLTHLRARDLAKEAKCAVGAIYNVFPDLDALIFEVNGRTLARFEQFLEKAKDPIPRGRRAGNPAVEQLIHLAVTYVDFAVKNHMRWRALFDHRVEDEGAEAIPDWYVAEQARMFDLVEKPLRDLRPDMKDEALNRFAKTMFSAVHGVVSLGLDTKLMALPANVLRDQVMMLVGALADGLLAGCPAPRPR